MKCKQLKQAFVFFMIMTVICGGVYTAVVSGASQILFPVQANGSIVTIDGEQYSMLLGQQYTDEKHLWGRVTKLDVTTFQDQDGNALAYAAPSNLSPASVEYEAIIAQRVADMRAAHPEMGDTPIPVELLTNSGSGLDPHISQTAAYYQAERLAKHNNMSVQEVKDIIDKCTEDKVLGLLGEKTVHVLSVNLMLDGKLTK